MSVIKLTNGVKVSSESLVGFIDTSSVLYDGTFTQNVVVTWTATEDCFFHITANSWGSSYVKINDVDLCRTTAVEVCGFLRKGDVITAKKDTTDGGNSIKIFGLK